MAVSDVVSLTGVGAVGLNMAKELVNPVEEGGAADLADLTVAEEAGERGARDAVEEDVAVVVGAAEKVLPSAQAGEEKGARGGRRLVVLNVAVHYGFEVVTGRLGVPDVELDDLSLAEHFADDEGPGLLVKAHDVTDEKVAGPELVLEGVHDDAQVQGRVNEPAVMVIRPVKDAAQEFQGTLAIELHEEVAVAPGYHAGLSDGPTSLGDNGVDLEVAMQGHAHCTGTVDFRAEEEGIGAGAHSAAGETSDFHTLAEGEVEAFNEAVGVDGEGVGEDNEVGRVLGFNAYDILPGRGAIVGGGEVLVFEVEKAQVNVGEDGGGYGDGGPVLDFPSITDDASARAADKVIDGEGVGDVGGDPAVLTLVSVGYEGEDEVGVLAPKVFLNLLGRLPDGVLQGFMFGNCG